MLAVAAHGAATSTAAQSTEWRADALYSSLKPAGGAQRSALSLAGFARQYIGPFTPTLGALATVAGDSVAAAQLAIGTSWVPRWNTRMPVEGGVTFALYGIAKGDRGQSRTASLRQHFVGDRSGWWIGGALAQIDRSASFGSNSADLAGWTLFGRNRLVAAVSTSSTSDRDVFAATRLTPDEFANKHRVADVSVSLQRTSGRLMLEGAAGLRLALKGVDGTASFGLASMSWRIRTSAHVVVSGGQQLADLLRGTPEWRFISIGLRLSGGRPPAARPPAVAVGPEISFAEVPGGLRIVVAAPASAQRVELVASFTQWQPLTLTHGDLGWEVVISNVHGAHQLAVSVDDGPFLPPANRTTIRDSFGKWFALIVFP